MFPVFPGRPNLSSGVGGIVRPGLSGRFPDKTNSSAGFLSPVQKYHISLGVYMGPDITLRQSDLKLKED